MRFSLSRVFPGILSAFVAIGAAQAQVHTLYQNNFETGQLGHEWTGNTSLDNQYQRYFTQFNGRYTNDRINLTLNSAPDPGQGKHNVYYVNFDLYIIDSWDGNSNSYGPDTFKVTVGNTTLLQTTFCNQNTNQSFPRRPDMGPFQMGFNQSWNDSIYRNIGLQFVAPQGTPFTITFAGVNLQAKSDESWGIDNIRVRYEAVPAPGAAATLALGGLLATRRRRA